MYQDGSREVPVLFKNMLHLYRVIVNVVKKSNFAGSEKNLLIYI